MPTDEEFEELASKVEELSSKLDQLNEPTPPAGDEMPDEEMNPAADPCPPKPLGFIWGGRQCWAPPVQFALTVKFGFGWPDAAGNPMSRIAKLGEE